MLDQEALLHCNVNSTKKNKNSLSYIKHAQSFVMIAQPVLKLFSKHWSGRKYGTAVLETNYMLLDLL